MVSFFEELATFEDLRMHRNDGRTPNKVGCPSELQLWFKPFTDAV
jgi:hypothetical protein